jgi:hypothetical protein
MDPTVITPSGATVTGYDSAALERYLAALAVERARLTAELDAARARVLRARAALDARRMLVVMVDRAVEEIAAKRRQAELVVGRIADGTNLSPAPTPSATPLADAVAR